ncbi:HET-domain-containing protein [Annulohypoxylon moriforme]|nr:HET-domain-containing protein [Annulohypoxylon moriforme]
MSVTERSDGFDRQTFTNNTHILNASEDCILPYHRRSPVIWCQERRGYSPIDADLSTFQRARGLGCETCQLIYEALATYKNIPLDQLTGRVWFNPGSLTISWELPSANEEEATFGHINLQFYFTSDFPCDPIWDFTKPLGKRDKLPARTDSEETFTQIQEWLKECGTTHTMCKLGANGGLPTRLLDLNEVVLAGIARLVEVKDISVEDGKYACLSHCWGGGTAENAKTTKKSLEGMKQGILVENLPKTFRHAIVVTRKIGVRYLWIDSMCILQDDELDWDRESKKMATIYRNSFITIAATWSRDSTQGFFHPSSRSDPYPFKCLTANGQPFDLYIRPILPHHERNLESKFYPLLYRAWAYQERLLSSRYLHFTLREVVWECNELMTCQCTPRDSPRFPNEFEDYSKRIYTEQINSANIDKLKAAWSSILPRFTHQALSFEKDRLRAVAGIANHLSSVELPSNPGKPVMGRYIEGLWEDRMCESLCWYAQPAGRHPKPRPADWRKWKAPTWSWASVQDPSHAIIDSYTFNQKSANLANFLEVQYITHPQACQEQVQYNCIRLELPTMEATLVMSLAEGAGPYESTHFIKWKLQVNGNDICEYSITIRPDYDYAINGPDHIASGRIVMCGLVLESLNPGILPINIGLLLIPVEEENGLYKRIGYFEYGSWELSPHLFTWKTILLV